MVDASILQKNIPLEEKNEKLQNKKKNIFLLFGLVSLDISSLGPVVLC